MGWIGRTLVGGGVMSGGGGAGTGYYDMIL
jgi:hypothetical protein